MTTQHTAMTAATWLGFAAVGLVILAAIPQPDGSARCADCRAHIPAPEIDPPARRWAP